MENKLPTPGKTLVVVGKGQQQQVITKPTVDSRGKVVEGQHEVDITFVFDTTGSMDDKITALLETCKQFVDEAKKLDMEPQFALVSFGDISVEGGGDRIEVVVSPTNNIEQIKSGLTNIPRNNGFGNDGESSMEALQEALKLRCRPKSVRVIILITDEPTHENRITAAEMTKRLRQREFLVFVVSPPYEYYKHMARENGGIWKEISVSTNLSEILEIFRQMAKKVSQVAKEVHKIGGGSVAKYLLLRPPEK